MNDSDQHSQQHSSWQEAAQNQQALSVSPISAKPNHLSDTQTEDRAGVLAEQLETAKLKGTERVFRQEGLPDFLGVPKSDKGEEVPFMN